jgi:hypothetical protein
MLAKNMIDLFLVFKVIFRPRPRLASRPLTADIHTMFKSGSKMHAYALS